MKHVLRMIILLALAAGSIRIIVNGADEPVEIRVQLPPPAKTAAAAESVWNLAASQNEVRFYRVRNAENAPESQIGAYTDLETAKSCCPANFCVFDQDGTLLFRQNVGAQLSASSPEQQSESN